jgi:prepilin-type N-terminal cleavage/methylation domain-containing protein
MGRQGFTLVELLVVLGIFSILLIMALPGLSRWRETVGLEFTARAAAIELRCAQSRALSCGEAVGCGRFRFARSGNTLPGGSGTETLRDRYGRVRKIIVSQAGRVRLD